MKAIVLLCVLSAAFAFREPYIQTCDEEPDSGMCLAYMPMYYYEASSGTCKRFIYGGCQGNGNRYATIEACEKHCSGVQSAGLSDDVCTLPKKVGWCYGRFPRYYFDQETGKCTRFIYGGCQGNGNNFQTEEECQSNCPRVQAALDRPDCDKAPEAGLCDAYMPRFYYDQEAGMCKTFIYGGCGGNRNNFRTRDECYNKCGALSAPSACEQEKVVGPCKAAIPRYYYNKNSGKCESFIYGGCRGNKNNFRSQETCEADCVVPRAPSKCSAQPETGLCRAYFPRFYYNQETKKCESFIYGGCGGNDNNYETEDECLESCAALSTPHYCQQKKGIGSCKSSLSRYYYNKNTGKCENFIFTGCGGNRNNFLSKFICESTCVE